jgi:hypothetical protein
MSFDDVLRVRKEPTRKSSESPTKENLKLIDLLSFLELLRLMFQELVGGELCPITPYFSELCNKHPFE